MNSCFIQEKFYIDTNMSTMQIVLVLFMAATLAVVVIGVIAMAVNGKLNKNHSNKPVSYTHLTLPTKRIV